MATPVIIDAIVVAILLVFLVCGTLRGLLRTLAGLVIVVVSLAGAGIAAARFSEPAAKLAAPLVEKQIAEKIRAVLPEQGLMPELPEGGLDGILERLGLDEAVWQPLLERIERSMTETGAGIVEAVTESLVHSVLYGLLFLLAFLALLILLNLLLKALNQVTKLPVIHGINAVGGGVLGLIEGALVLFLAVWIARKLGVSFETELFEGAHILRIFTANTPLGVLSFLQ